VCDVSLDDSALTLCLARANIKESNTRDIDAIEGWVYAACDVRCPSCDLFLGVKLKSMRKKQSVLGTEEQSALLEALVLGALGVRRVAFHQPSSRPSSNPSPRPNLTGRSYLHVAGKSISAATNFE